MQQGHDETLRIFNKTKREIDCEHQDVSLNDPEFQEQWTLLQTYQLMERESNDTRRMDIQVFGQTFRLGRKIGYGSFGEVHRGTNMITGEEVALKLEVKTAEPHLLRESECYHMLHGGVGIPNIHWYGVEKDYNVLALDLLGPSLQSLFHHCGQRFQLKTILMIADQTLSRLQLIHGKGFIHRDIKPENFLIGLDREQEAVIHIIDFGLAKNYQDRNTLRHIPYREDKKGISGTARYASLNTHVGIEQSRRDDLESLGYMLIYFLKGRLPWQGLKARNKKHWKERIFDLKMSISIAQLCNDVPLEFRSYFEYCRALPFEAQPDYVYLKQMFKDLFYRNGFQDDSQFEWKLVQNRSERKQRKKRRAD